MEALVTIFLQNMSHGDVWDTEFSSHFLETINCLSKKRNSISHAHRKNLLLFVA
jgi:hypothetical protein